jgi:hypothetical protein
MSTTWNVIISFVSSHYYIYVLIHLCVLMLLYLELFRLYVLLDWTTSVCESSYTYVSSYYSVYELLVTLYMYQRAQVR